MAQYTEKDHRKAADLFIRGGMTMTDIAAIMKMSRTTLIQWKKAGFGSDGVDWDEAREKIQYEIQLHKRAEALERRNEVFDNVVEAAKADIKDAIFCLMDKIREGSIKNASYAQLPQLYDKLLELENRDSLREMMGIMVDFVKEVGEVVSRHVEDEGRRRVIAAELQSVLTRYQDELEPILSGKKKSPGN